MIRLFVVCVSSRTGSVPRAVGPVHVPPPGPDPDPAGPPHRHCEEETYLKTVMTAAGETPDSTEMFHFCFQEIDFKSRLCDENRGRKWKQNQTESFY